MARPCEPSLSDIGLRLPRQRKRSRKTERSARAQPRAAAERIHPNWTKASNLTCFGRGDLLPSGRTRSSMVPSRRRLQGFAMLATLVACSGKSHDNFPAYAPGGGGAKNDGGDVVAPG